MRCTTVTQMSELPPWVTLCSGDNRCDPRVAQQCQQVVRTRGKQQLERESERFTV